MRPSIQPKKKQFENKESSYHKRLQGTTAQRVQEVKSILAEMSDSVLAELLEQLNNKPVFKNKKKYTTAQQRVKIIHNCELCGSQQTEHAMIDSLAKYANDETERVINNTRTHCADCVERLMLEEKNMLVVKLLSLVDKYDKKV